MAKQRCRCGAIVEEINSYFEVKGGARITMCDKCAAEYGLTDTSKYYSIPHSNLKGQKRKNAS